ncbi:MAG: glucose-6-phosphate isomerase, partial [Alphaproteobacteria bacterium]|nr:glucose-6-phosphate isomerase [Alphaproteobacteria bacterium]
MLYNHKIENCFSAAIGESGLEKSAFDPLLAQASAIASDLKSELAAGGLAPLALALSDPDANTDANTDDDLAEMEDVAEHLRENFDRLVVLGTGGSSLGGQALTTLVDGEWYRTPDGLTLDYMDNLDGYSFNRLLTQSNRGRTAFLVVSKSGSTVETLTQFLTALQAVRETMGEKNLQYHFILITEPGDNPLRRIAAQFNIRVLDHPVDVGGRFSVLSLVGLIPAMAAGQDASLVRKGAARVLEETLGRPATAAPVIGAAIAVGLSRHNNISTSVMMPYGNQLKSFAAWYCQLWAESLGKNGQGTTPVQANGPVDQHSQLQLFLDGPADKMFTLIGMNTTGSGPKVTPELATLAGFDFLGGKAMGDVSG